MRNIIAVLSTLMVLYVIASSITGCDSNSKSSQSGTWSLSGNTFAHDPTIIKAGSQWYLFYTGTGIQMKTSSGGHDWSEPSPVFPGALSWWANYTTYSDSKGTHTMRANDVWAPDIHYYNGKYYIYYCVSVFGSQYSAIGLISSDSIHGPWTDHGSPVLYSTPSSPYNCIDPTFFEEPVSGNIYLSFGSWWHGIYVVQLDPDTMLPAADAAPANIAYRYPLKTSESPDGTAYAIEAPGIIYNSVTGYYYLFVSFDKCCAGSNSTYKIAYGRSKSITGPYTDKDGTDMLNGGGTVLDKNDGHYIPGGEFIYNDNGQWLCVHHAYNIDNKGIAMLRIKNLYFDSDGWPTYRKP